MAMGMDMSATEKSSNAPDSPDTYRPNSVPMTVHSATHIVKYFSHIPSLRFFFAIYLLIDLQDNRFLNSKLFINFLSMVCLANRESVLWLFTIWVYSIKIRPL